MQFGHAPRHHVSDGLDFEEMCSANDSGARTKSNRQMESLGQILFSYTYLQSASHCFIPGLEGRRGLRVVSPVRTEFLR